jgi:hypothetical protein
VTNGFGGQLQRFKGLRSGKVNGIHRPLKSMICCRNVSYNDGLWQGSLYNISIISIPESGLPEKQVSLEPFSSSLPT